MSNTTRYSRRKKNHKLNYYVTYLKEHPKLGLLAFVLVALGTVFIFTSLTSGEISADSKIDLGESSYTVSETATVSDSNAKIYTKDGEATSIDNGTSLSITAYYYAAALDDEDVTLAEFSMDGSTYYIPASAISLTQTNSINDYIASTLDYSHSKITKDIESSFEQSVYKTDDGNPIGVIIHDTGTDNSTIESEVNYMVQNYDTDGVFVHSFIDSDTILRIADEDYEAQGAGAKANPYYIQFELTHEETAKGFAEQLANAAYYTAYMLKKYDLPVTVGQEDGTGTVWTHEMVSEYLGGTDHIDPTDYWTEMASTYFDDQYTVEDFVELVQAYYNQL